MTKPIASVAIVNGERHITLTKCGRRKLDDAAAVLEALSKMGANVNEHFAGYIEAVKQRHSPPATVRQIKRSSKDQQLPKGDRT